MRGIWQDVRFAARVLVKNRWFTVAAVVALALGIGANSAVFTLVNAVLLRGLPFDRPEEIVALYTREARGREFGVSLEDFEDFRRASKTIPTMALAFGANFSISGDDKTPEYYPGTYMSATAFQIAGEKPIIGRVFTPEDDRLGAPPVAVLGYTVWKTRYGGDENVLGRTIRVQALDAVVVGVMRDGMKFPFNSELWLPEKQIPPALRAQGRAVRNYMVFGRLAGRTTVEQARAEMTNISRELSRQFPASNKDMTAAVSPFVDRVAGGPIRLMFWSLMGAVAFVLLIACSNVANLLLAQAADRAREVGVRVALGATRWRIIRQLLVESVMLSVISGLVGLWLAQFGIKWFDAAVTGVGKPYWMVFTMDARVFAFFAAVSIATGILFGLVPAMHISKTNLNEVLKEGGRTGAGGTRTRRWASALVVAQVTLTLVLLAGAGFMMRSFLVLYRMDYGVNTDRLLTMSLTMPARKYPSVSDRSAFMKKVDERLAANGAIEYATTASNLPVGFGYGRLLAIEGRTLPGEKPPNVTTVTAGPHYFETIGLRLQRGRALADADGVSQQSAVINRRLADMYFQGQDPIGQRIKLTEEFPTGPQSGWFTIVGVSPTVRQSSMQQLDPDPVVYIPHLELPGLARTAFLIVRTRGDAGKATALVRDELRALDPDMPLYNIRTMEEQLALQRWPYRVFGAMFATFALIALLLSAVGLYAVTAYSVTQRTQEIGVRMALGAGPKAIRWLILRRALVQLSIGLTLGLAGAFGVGRLLRSMIVQISTADPATLTTIVAVLVAVAIAACVWPARRATRLDPVVALRYE